MPRSGPMGKLPTLPERQIEDTIRCKVLYIKAFKKIGFPRKAAATMGIGHRTVVRWRANDPEFARQELEARQHYKEKLEKEADRRAVDGILDPIMHDGKVVHHRRKYSDDLLKFRLKKLDPDYRDSSGGSSSSGPTTVNIYLPDNSRPDNKVMIDVTPSTPLLPDKG